MKKTLLAAFVLCLMPISLAQAQNWETVELKATHLAGPVHMIAGRGGNIGLSAGPDATFLVDDQFAPLTEKLVVTVGEITERPIDFVLNTHWHGDHTGGNENLGVMGALIFAREAVRERLIAKHFKGQAGFVSDPGLPLVTFDDQLTFHINGEAVVVSRVPAGHTDGDAIVHFTGSDVLHLGDLFFNGLYSFFDRSSGGSLEGMIQGLALALEKAGPETQIIPGHGPLASRADLQAHLERLQTIRARTVEAMAAGQSKAAFIAANPTADLAAAYQAAGGTYQVMAPEKFLGLVWDDLAN